MPEILVTGSTGQLGQAFQILSGNFSAFRFTFITRDELDFSKPADVAAYLLGRKYDAIFHCAAYTQVDKAESDADLAFAVNCEGVKELAAYCGRTGCLPVYFSSDYVYHNGMRRPLEETDPCEPRSVYAKSKRCGEEAIIDQSLNYFIIRTSWLYSHVGNNFVKTMLRKKDATLRVVNDQLGAPTYAPDLARATMQIVVKYFANSEAEQNELSGVYNFANLGQATWYQFAERLFEIKGIDADITPVTTEEYPVIASRPAYSVLNTEKIRSQFSIDIAHWENALGRCLEQL